MTERIDGMTPEGALETAESRNQQTEDGRHIDSTLGALSGEGSGQRTTAEEARAQGAGPEQVFSNVPSVWEANSAEPTYYGKPSIKKPVWIWTIPAYFYVGGLAGAAMVLGSAAQVIGGKDMRHLAQRCHWVGAVSGGIGSALLIADLGRPMRFLSMLRVFRPTSPMSVGSWVLAAATPCSLSAALFYRPRGLTGIIGEAGGYGAGILGIPLAGYTGVLLANTAVPLWQQTRRWMPVLFVASSMASAAAVLRMFPLKRGAQRAVQVFGMAGSALELASGMALEREAARVESVGRPLKQGAAGALWKSARVLTTASLVVSILPGQSRRTRMISGVLGTLGSLALRFAVFHAGKVSAGDPRATFRQQRAGFGAMEVTGQAAVAGPENVVQAKPVPAPRSKEEIQRVTLSTS